MGVRGPIDDKIQSRSTKTKQKKKCLDYWMGGKITGAAL